MPFPELAPGRRPLTLFDLLVVVAVAAFSLSAVRSPDATVAASVSARRISGVPCGVG